MGKHLLASMAAATRFPSFVGAPAMAAEVGQDAIDGCIDRIRAVGGPDGQGGTVISTEYSEANSLVMFRDRGETVWRCLVSNDGVVADLSVTQAADDGGGAMAGAPLVRTDGLTAYWFNRDTGACAAITTSDGRYSKVEMLPAEDC